MSDVKRNIFKCSSRRQSILLYVQCCKILLEGGNNNVKKTEKSRTNFCPVGMLVRTAALFAEERPRPRSKSPSRKYKYSKSQLAKENPTGILGKPHRKKSAAFVSRALAQNSKGDGEIHFPRLRCSEWVVNKCEEPVWWWLLLCQSQHHNLRYLSRWTCQNRSERKLFFSIYSCLFSFSVI